MSSTIKTDRFGMCSGARKSFAKIGIQEGANRDDVRPQMLVEGGWNLAAYFPITY